VEIPDKNRRSDQSKDDGCQSGRDCPRGDIFNEAKIGKQLEARMKEPSKKIDH
jgi:hypothetical protein